MHDDPDQAEGFWNRWRDLRQCRRELHHGGSIERSTTHRKLVCKFLSHRHATRRKYFKQRRVRQSLQRQTPLQRRNGLTRGAPKLLVIPSGVEESLIVKTSSKSCLDLGST